MSIINSGVVIYGGTGAGSATNGSGTMIEQKFSINTVFPARTADSFYTIYASDYGPFGTVIATNPSAYDFTVIVYDATPAVLVQLTVKPLSSYVITFQAMAKIVVQLGAGPLVQPTFDFDVFAAGLNKV